ncbi:hypothetical protein C8Q78DRAFT_547333 [Trametes maxima]|nr:hypothetical protein C8Q78DRAFT_547333 [Trametes maxima]
MLLRLALRCLLECSSAPLRSCRLWFRTQKERFRATCGMKHQTPRVRAGRCTITARRDVGTCRVKALPNFDHCSWSGCGLPLVDRASPTSSWRTVVPSVDRHPPWFCHRQHDDAYMSTMEHTRVTLDSGLQCLREVGHSLW